MNRRHFLMIVGVGAVASAPAFASTYEDSIVAQLTSQGYRFIKVERTLLGRVKIVGQLDTGRREIILNPRTGEILRDLWVVNEGGLAVLKIRDKSDTSGKGADDGGENVDGDNSDGDNSGGDSPDHSGGDDVDDDDSGSQSDNGGSDSDSGDERESDDRSGSDGDSSGSGGEDGDDDDN